MNRVPPECERLAAELHALRRRSGLSLAALAAASAYSKSSWDRYVSGKAMPPWHAVSALARLAGEPEPRLRALWELADSAWSGRGAVAPARAAGPAPGRAARRAPESAVPPAPPAPPAPVRDGEPAPPPGTPPAPVPPPASAPVTGTGTPAGGAAGRRRAPALAAAAAAGALLSGALLVLHNVPGWDRTQGSPAAGAALSRSGAAPADCRGASCNGRDPVTVLCTRQPLSLFQDEIPGKAGLQIRYSPACGAAWARVWQAQVGDTLTVISPSAPKQTVLVTPQNVSQFVNTPMLAVPPGGRLLACLDYPPSGASQCYTATARAAP